MPCAAGDAAAGDLLLAAAAAVPAYQYLIAAAAAVAVFLYNFLEFHFLGDIATGLRGQKVVLTFDPASVVYQGVVAKCRALHGRYLATPWLASPHFQTAFLNFFGNPPVVIYRRQLFTMHDGGTIALDWLLASDGKISEANSTISKEDTAPISKDDTTPIVLLVPGLTSDSSSAYLKHIAHEMAKKGWNVVIGNHRGLGGVSVTSDCFYNGGWTKDVREVINYLHQEYPEAPLFAIGTSIGANILIKYLGEERDRTPIAGAVSVCCPYDLLIGDRFIVRKLVQRLYGRMLAIGLRGYAQLHQPIFTRLGNWDGIEKASSVRDFDTHATSLIGKYETVDTYYRWASSAPYVQSVSVPLLCLSALDDPVCTKEAIPWDECRANKNIVLATTAHGGHLAFFKGITGRSLWWVGAVSEFLTVLHSSPYTHQQKKTPASEPDILLESCIDKSPFVNITEDGMVAPTLKDHQMMNHELVPETERPIATTDPTEERTEVNQDSVHKPADADAQEGFAETLLAIAAPLKRSINQITRRGRGGASTWLLAYIAIMSTWPLVGSILMVVFRKKLMKNTLPAAWLRGRK